MLLLAPAAHAAGVTSVVIPPVAPLVGYEGKSVPPDVIDRVNAELAAALPRIRFKVQKWKLEAETPKPKPVPAALNDLLELARGAARELDYAKAVQLYNSAIDALDKRYVEIGDAVAVAEAHLALAAVYLGMEEPALAANSLARAVSLRPGMDLDPRRYPPTLITAFNEAKSRLLAEPGAKLAVEITPAGSAIYLDGQAVGETPATLEVCKGPHLVQIAREGHAPFATRVDAVTGGRIKLTEALPRAKAYDLVDALNLEIATQNRRTEALSIARALSTEVKADAAVIVGVAPIKGGYGLFATLTSEPTQSIVGVSNASLVKGGVILSSMVNRLYAASQQPTTAPVELVSMNEPGVSLVGLTIAFDKQLLGLVPPPPPTVLPNQGPGHATATGPGGGGVPHIIGPPPPPPPSVWSSPLLWGGLGVAVVGGAVLTWQLLDRRTTETVQDPDRLIVNLGSIP